MSRGLGDVYKRQGHTIYLPMMSHDDVKIIEERTMSNLRGVESDV
ncbi:hypothetical protein JMUB7533_24680 [Staphylococcus aureus]